MPDVVLQQAILYRDHAQGPRLTARSSGLTETQASRLSDLVVAFGDRPPGVACPRAVFAQPLGATDVAIIQAEDAAPGPDGWAALRFHALVLGRQGYEALGADPFALADRFPVNAVGSSSELVELTCPAGPLRPRGLAEVRAVLQRVKANALPEGADPEKLPPPSAENAESPTLLGAAQVLVDGGKVVFERARPDASVVAALWTLLPHSLRPTLWPASFAFANDLGFDVLVVPDLRRLPLEGFTTEAQAGDYPAGSYELALQTAAEAGNEADVQAALHRRSSNETMRLAVRLLVGMALLVVAFRWLAPPPTELRTDTVARAATVAGAVAVGHPFTAAAMVAAGDLLFRPKERP